MRAGHSWFLRSTCIRLLWTLAVVQSGCAPENAPAAGDLHGLGTHALTESFPPIGVPLGSPDHELDRPTAAVVAGPDLIAVTNSYSEIRFYSTDGQLVRTIGRRGGGPREFGQLIALFPDESRDSSVYAFDNGNNSLTRIAFDGKWDEPVRLKYPRGPNTRMAILGRGMLIAAPRILPIGSTRQGMAAVRDTGTVYVYRRDGSVGWQIELPLTSKRITPMGEGTLPFGAAGAMAGIGDTLVYTPGDRAELVFYRNGRELDKITVPLEGVAVTPAVIRSYEDEARARWAALTGDTRYQPVPAEVRPLLPAQLPFYSRLVTAGRCVWAERYRTPGADAVTGDLINPRDRTFITTVVPAGVRLTDFTRELAVGLSRGDYDAPVIVGYRLPGVAESCWG